MIYITEFIIFLFLLQLPIFAFRSPVSRSISYWGTYALICCHCWYKGGLSLLPLSLSLLHSRRWWSVWSSASTDSGCNVSVTYRSQFHRGFRHLSSHQNRCFCLMFTIFSFRAPQRLSISRPSFLTFSR